MNDFETIKKNKNKRKNHNTNHDYNPFMIEIIGDEPKRIGKYGYKKSNLLKKENVTIENEPINE